MKKFIFAVVSIVAVSGGIPGANAGGLFGDGGLIRGDVGRALQPVQQHVLTPIVRGTVTGVTTGVGGVVGGYYGGPAGAVVGGAAGNATGNTINRCFAGQC